MSEKGKKSGKAHLHGFDENVCKQLGYYVYRLIDPRNGNTFYVGKGKGNRVFDHIKDAEKVSDDIQNKNQGSHDEKITSKLDIIKEIKAAGLEVIIVIHRHAIKNEKIAFEIESALIDAYPGLANVVAGHGSDYGAVNARQIVERYGLSVADIDKNDKLLLIKIRQETVDSIGNIYDAVRSSWVIGEKRKKVKYAAAVINGVIREVFEITGGWKQKENNRWEFNGKEAPSDIRKKYNRKRIPMQYMRQGAATPIRYTF